MAVWRPGEEVTVILDETGDHRLKLVCSWDKKLPCCLYIMLNPSTADMKECDPTLGKCIKIAKHNNFGSIAVVNLFSYRTPSPQTLLEAEVRSHPENLDYVRTAIDEAEVVIAAWGEQGVWFNGNYPVLKYIEDSGKKLFCLKETRHGYPRHPLYMKSDTVLREYVYRDGLAARY